MLIQQTVKVYKSYCEVMTELERLHSRLEQQSGLICMLKQRNDKILLELSEATSRCEMTCQHMESLQQSLAQEMGQRKLIEKRFHDLAENHQQMIRLKDEYKEEARGLREKAGREEEGQRRSLELEEELLRMQCEWMERLRGVEERLGAVQAEKEAAERRADELQRKINETLREHMDSTQHLQTNMKVAEEETAAVRCECHQKEGEINRLGTQITQLHKDLQISTSKVKDASLKIEHLEGEISLLKAKDRARAEKLSKDTLLCSLREQLQQSQQDLTAMKKEYAAYKTHSAELLAHERKLNQQLRHLLE